MNHIIYVNTKQTKGQRTHNVTSSDSAAPRARDADSRRRQFLRLAVLLVMPWQSTTFNLR